jgi:glutamyl-tRNA synthetase
MGGVRTALYNYLYAKKHGGDFLIRIEDTDSRRFVPGAEKYIIDSLKWCGIIPDEGVDENGNVVSVPSPKHPHAPYRQSERKGIYRKYAEQLVETGHAYYAFDTEEDLDRMRKECESRGETFIYNWQNRASLVNSLTLPPSEVAKRLQDGHEWTVRFKCPENRTIRMHDLIRGDIEVNSSIVDDKVLWKASDGLPTYHLANIVDDHLMDITEVIRGEEWLPSLPLHYMLYEAFGWKEVQPRFAHLSLLLKPSGKGKLSKRDGDKLGFPVFPLKWIGEDGTVTRSYREDGYYPEAFVNMLALLGWNPGTEQEIFTMDELINAFSLDRVVKSGARFNPEKAKWFNEQYLRKQSTSDLVAQFREVAGENLKGFSDGYVGKVCELVRERVHFVNELWGQSSFFFEAPAEYDPASVAKFWNDATDKSVVPALAEFICTVEPFTKEELEKRIPEWVASHSAPDDRKALGRNMNTLRLFIVGASNGPSIADIIILIGKDEFLKRVGNAVKILK